MHTKPRPARSRLAVSGQRFVRHQSPRRRTTLRLPLSSCARSRLVPLQFADRRRLGIAGSAAHLFGVDQDISCDRVLAEVAKQAGPTQAKQSVSGTSSLTVHAHDTQHHRIPRFLFSPPSQSLYQRVHSVHRRPYCYLVAGDSRGPTASPTAAIPAAGSTLRSRPRIFTAPRAPPRLLAVPRLRRKFPAVEQHRLQTPRPPSCCPKNRYRLSCRLRPCPSRTSQSTMPRLRHLLCSLRLYPPSMQRPTTPHD